MDYFLLVARVANNVLKNNRYKFELNFYLSCNLEKLN